MIIPIYFNYKYKNYPFSPKATQRSKMLGLLTCTTMCLLWGFFWFAIIGYALSLCGCEEEAAYIIAFVSLIAFVFIIKRIKNTSAVKIEQMAMADLCALQHTDPVSYIQFATAYKEELSRYYEANSFRTAGQGYNSNQKYNTEQNTKTQNANTIPAESTDIAEHTVTPDVHETSESDEQIPSVQEHERENPVSDNSIDIPNKCFCGHCGVKLKPGSMFCHNCGTKA